MKTNSIKQWVVGFRKKSLLNECFLFVHHPDWKVVLTFHQGDFPLLLPPCFQPISWSYQQCVFTFETAAKANRNAPTAGHSWMEEGCVCVCVCVRNLWVQCLHSTGQLALDFFSVCGRRYIKVRKDTTATALGKHSIMFNSWDIILTQYRNHKHVVRFIFIW